jgi:hypothetical protein
MPPVAMQELVEWLSASKNPVLVQMPAGEYRSLAVSWELPRIDG